ncbi:MAG: hypothetical protein IJ880_06300 [Bacilli bacterium]|nr:hypothetical protein [Bacilli bacterium]
MYYKIQFFPYEEFAINYLGYSKEKGFYYTGERSAIHFSEYSISDNKVQDFLKDKTYKLIEETNPARLYLRIYRG